MGAIFPRNLRNTDLGISPPVNGHPLGRCARTASGRVWTAANGTALEALSDGVADQLERSKAVKSGYDRGARTRYARGLAARKDIAARSVGRSSHRGGRCGRKLCRADRGGSSGQSPQSGAGARTEPDRGQCQRRWPLRGQFEGRHQHIPADARLAFSGSRRRAAQAAIAAADVAGLSVVQGRLPGDTDHGPDHLPDRRHHRAAGLLPFPQVRRRFLCRRHGRHPGAARNSAC